MKNISGTSWKNALAGLAMAVLSLSAAGASAQSAEVLTLNIEPQQAGPALMELASSSGVQIMLPDQAGDEVEVKGLKGSYKLEEALAALLADTSLTYEFTSENVVLVQEVEQAQDLDDVEAAGAPQDSEEEEPVELTPQTVTGSRLKGGDPSARVYSFTAEDIAVRGVSNLEDFFRTLPWAFPSTTTQTNMSYDTPSSRYANGSDSRDEKWEQLGLGVSTVNLRALGSANTLVLVNGRRIAGKAGEEEDFANLLTVPLSAIERIEIQLDGASAVYGSDAIGGVVNFITKKNYRGLSIDYRNEYSSTDSDVTKASVTGGYAWGSGNVTAILARRTSDPITNAKTGWSSSDFRDYLGPEFDLRSTSNSQPGVVCELFTWPWAPYNFQCPPSYLGSTKWQLPADHSGVGATVEDFKVDDVTPLDWITPQNGADSSTESLSVNLEQYITDDLRVYADILYARHEAYQEHDLYMSGAVIPVPASNAYNPFGRAVGVLYTPLREYGEGLWPDQYTESKSEERTINLGMIWTFGGSQELSLEATRAKSEREAYSIRARTRRDRWDPTADAYYEALSSSDPNRAINVFGNGSAQVQAFADLLTLAEGPLEGETEKRAYNLTLRGNLFNLWAGPVSYSVGAERREEFVLRKLTRSDWNSHAYVVASSADAIGVKRPLRDTQAYYAEFALPLVGSQNARPGVHSLILTLQARRDVYESEGSHFTQKYKGREFLPPIKQPYWHPDEGWTTYDRTNFRNNYDEALNITTIKNSRTSPRVGLRYQPVSTFTMRGAWSRSFRPPVWSDQFSATRPVTRGRQPYFDPYDPDGPSRISVPYVDSIYNPDLRSEHSDNYSLGFDWSPVSIPGLHWTVDWSSVDFTNKIEDIRFILRSDPELVFNNPEIVVRDEQGHVVEVRTRPVNLDAKYSEIVETRLQYAFETAWGSFTPGVRYTRVLDEHMRFTPNSPKVTDLGTQNGSNKYNLQGSLSWQWNRFAADLFVYYTPAYLNDGALYCSWYTEQIPGNRCTESSSYIELDVSSLTTVDLTLTYRFDNGLRVRAGGRNILDRGAPVTLFGTTYPYDPTRWDARGQVLFIDLNWEM